VARFHQTWPVILLAVGVVKLLQGNASVEGHVSTRPLSSQAETIPPVNPGSPVPPVSSVAPTNEVNRG